MLGSGGGVKCLLSLKGLLPTNLAALRQYSSWPKALPPFVQRRLSIFEEEEERQKYADHRRGQIGTGDRSERIRTYNFPQNRLTDHRIQLTLYKLDTVMEGALQEVVEPIRSHFQAEALKAYQDG